MDRHITIPEHLYLLDRQQFKLSEMALRIYELVHAKPRKECGFVFSYDVFQ